MKYISGFQKGNMRKWQGGGECCWESSCRLSDNSGRSSSWAEGGESYPAWRRRELFSLEEESAISLGRRIKLTWRRLSSLTISAEKEPLITIQQHTIRAICQQREKKNRKSRLERKKGISLQAAWETPFIRRTKHFYQAPLWLANAWNRIVDIQRACTDHFYDHTQLYCPKSKDDFRWFQQWLLLQCSQCMVNLRPWWPSPNITQH